MKPWNFTARNRYAYVSIRTHTHTHTPQALRNEFFLWHAAYQILSAMLWQNWPNPSLTIHLDTSRSNTDWGREGPPTVISTPGDGVRSLGEWVLLEQLWTPSPYLQSVCGTFHTVVLTLLLFSQLSFNSEALGFRYINSAVWRQCATTSCRCSGAE